MDAKQLVVTTSKQNTMILSAVVRLNSYTLRSPMRASVWSALRCKSTTAVVDTIHPPNIRNGLVNRALEELRSIKEAGTYKAERVLQSPQATSIEVSSDVDKKSTVLNFCANNYLGLSSHPRLIDAAHKALDSRGFGLSSVRFICGTQDIHKELERTIADFHSMDDTILYPSCFDANAGIFEALLGPEDAVISDALNHASLIDGIRLCKAQRHRYIHSDMDDLKKILQETQSCQNRLIVTDGVFSMDGDVARLPDICELAEKYDAHVLIDDCHATGFFGKTGRGTPEHCGVEGHIDIINSTLGKALGGATGGYTTASQPIVDLLRQKSRPYLFSNTLAPSVVGASLETFKILNESSERVEKLASNVALFRGRMADAGFTLAGDVRNAIAPVMLGDAKLATLFANDMLKRDIYVIGFSYPVVPKGQARIRVQLSAAHTKDEVNRAVDAFIEVGREHGVIH